MKTERRHELQTNVLANSLGHWVERIKPYGGAFLAGGIALVIAVLAWGYVSTQSSRREADGWNEYLEALNTQNTQLLNEVAENYSGTMVAQWARLTAADLQLNNGTNQILQNRATAREELQDAAENFSALLLDSSQATILERATFGLARAHEALGELEKAREEYQTVAEKWPQGPFTATAKARAADLERQGTKQFYDWLARYEPPAPLSKEPGKPGARPDFLQEPDAGTMKLPSSLGDSKPLPNLGDTPSETPAAEPALPGVETPATETPATEAPATETPATETPVEAPAAETPATEAPAASPQF